jgi:2-polyprenyl-6-methoxyphenol hydroxylase-like FAD-dependent oxidoreductase
MTQDNTPLSEIPLKRSCDVVIVGAGVVGLYTAIMLKKQGVDVQIYERQAAMYSLPKACSLSDESVRSFYLNGFDSLVKEHTQSAGLQCGNPHFTWTDAESSECSAE